jgi:protein phosphatase 1 regulatory subunit 7
VPYCCLDLANNKLRDISGLKGLSQLKKIDLGANRIRVMDAEELSGLVNLEELWLGKNKIEMIQGLEKLTKLRRLDVQSNRLTTVENLQSQLETLEELYLSHNAITTEGASIATGLAQAFTNLSVLDLSRNRLATCQPFAHLQSLEELWLSGNKIASFDVVKPLAELPLETIYLEYNPLQEDPLYRKKLAETIPSLKQIDANMIHPISYATASSTAATKPKDPVESEEERLRRLQDVVVKRAKKETYGDGAQPPSTK